MKASAKGEVGYVGAGTFQRKQWKMGEVGYWESGCVRGEGCMGTECGEESKKWNSNY